MASGERRIVRTCRVVSDIVHTNSPPTRDDRFAMLLALAVRRADAALRECVLTGRIRVISCRYRERPNPCMEACLSRAMNNALAGWITSGVWLMTDLCR